jgi:hydrogenase-4 component E
MNIDIFLLCILITAFVMVTSKRITSLINWFSYQSFFLFLLTAYLAYRADNAELYIVAFFLFLLKVVLIPAFLRRVVKRIKVNEDLGLFVNPAVSVFITIFLVYLAYVFAGNIISMPRQIERDTFFISLSIMLVGMFIMVFRMKALAQIIGLLIIENGLFLAAGSVSGGMPFFVEIAIFFDVFLCVIILGIFVYKINKLFTHIDVDKLTELKG